jgi:hypothetical protein
MSKQDGQCCYVIILAVGFVAALMPCIAAAGSEMPANLSAPVIERLDDGPMQLKQPGGEDVQTPAPSVGPPATELLLVTRQSCRIPLGSTPLSAISLPGGGDRNGEWVLLAGVGWNRDSGFGAVLIETQGQREQSNWYFTVEMLFVPDGRWNVRASLAIDGEGLHDAIAAPDLQLNPLHIGVAIAFDHGDESTLVLNLGYGRLPLEGRVWSVQPDGTQPDQVLAETRIFSACLNIQW